MAPPRCLWLEPTQHIGHVGGTATSPEATFVGTASENRVDGLSNGLAPMLKYRVTSVYTETGGQLDASYSDTECVRGSPPQPHANDKRCYPARGPPEGGAELTDWFPKYAVTQVAAIDRPPGPWLHTSTGTWGLVTAIKTWTQTATVHNPTIHGTYIHCVLAGENTVLVQNVKPGQNAI